MLTGLLYQVHAADVGVFRTAAAFLAATAFTACYLPARRAAKVDLIASLRYK